jgi:hypothetical protein
MWPFNKSNQESDMITETIDLLGKEARDKISGFKGVISSVSFDLYGCVQIVLAPKANESGDKIEDSRWFDVHRLEVTSSRRVMDVPDFKALARKPSEFKHGPAEKPAHSL